MLFGLGYCMYLKDANKIMADNNLNINLLKGGKLSPERYKLKHLKAVEITEILSEL